MAVLILSTWQSINPTAIFFLPFIPDSQNFFPFDDRSLKARRPQPSSKLALCFPLETSNC